LDWIGLGGVMMAQRKRRREVRMWDGGKMGMGKRGINVEERFDYEVYAESLGWANRKVYYYV
jgi:hypothetical protein